VFNESTAIEADNSRVIEMWTRVLSGFTPIYGIFCLMVLASAPLYGWWVALPIIVDAVKGSVALTFASKGHHVETIYIANQYAGIVLIGATIFLSGGVGSPFLPFLAAFAGLFPVLFTKSRAHRSFVFLLVVTLVASFGPDRVTDFDSALRLGTVLCLILALRVFGTELLDSGLRYQSESLVDELTGLANRRAFDGELRAMDEALARRPDSAALVIGDIDFFKTVNDVHGHPTGDVVLQEIAKLLTRAFRENDVAFRIGGEEFAFIIGGVTSKRAEEMVTALCDRVRTAHPAGLAVSMSFGVAMHNVGESNEKWLDRADAALYKAKRDGRNRVEMAAA